MPENHIGKRGRLQSDKRTITMWAPSGITDKRCEIIAEEPLSIRVQGKPYAVIMRTPGDEIVHVAGFCLSEGIIDSPEDIKTIAFCDDRDTNVVTVTLTEARRKKVAQHLLDRRGYVSQTSCGICGKTLIHELYQDIRPVDDGGGMDPAMAEQCIARLGTHQPLRRQTRASHAAALFGTDTTLLAAAEDVGRHNALDKAIGKLFLNGTLHKAGIVALSSRISYELVQKTAKARIPLVVSVSRPTALAVRLAHELNITLACLAPESGLMIFCHGQRLRI